MKRRALITAATVIMLGGLWWQFTGNGSANPTEPNDLETTTTTTPTEQAEGPEDYFDQEDPTNPTTNEDNVDGAENLATPEEIAECVPVQNGFGIQMKDWGKIRLPYADRWPKNEPGQPVDCAPETDFGAAVVAAHSLYIESLSPELIPQIAKDTPSRQQRINRHPGGKNPADLDWSCEPVGWDRQQPGIYVWRIFHRCGDGPIEYTAVRMHYENNQWIMVYGIDGRVYASEPDPGTEYYPFEGGD